MTTPTQSRADRLIAAVRRDCRTDIPGDHSVAQLSQECGGLAETVRNLVAELEAFEPDSALAHRYTATFDGRVPVVVCYDWSDGSIDDWQIWINGAEVSQYLDDEYVVRPLLAQVEAAHVEDDDPDYEEMARDRAEARAARWEAAGVL